MKLFNGLAVCLALSVALLGFGCDKEKNEVTINIVKPVANQAVANKAAVEILAETIDLSSFPSGTKFHLEAEACLDHKCKEKVSKEIEFTIP